MRNLSLLCIVAGVVTALVGGISRLTMTPYVTNARVWVGSAAILLLLAIALNTLPRKEG